jgi:hypothetical protein
MGKFGHYCIKAKQDITQMVEEVEQNLQKFQAQLLRLPVPILQHQITSLNKSTNISELKLRIKDSSLCLTVLTLFKVDTTLKFIAVHT